MKVPYLAYAGTFLLPILPASLISFTLIAAMISVPLTVTSQQLHNGIVLPGEWPPRNAFAKAPVEMQVPYLDKKPEAIPVNNGRQLFVDDFLINQTNLERTFHTPRFYAGNPVLKQDREWEKTRIGSSYAAPFSDGIWYDETDRKFKLWYLTGAGMLHKGSDETFYTGYAESADGKNWVKPSLDVFNRTNIVDTCERDAATIWIDKQEKDPAKRFKFFNVERRPKDRKWAFVLKYSPDGIHWFGSEGYLLTEPLSFDGRYLFVNADVKGRLSAEMLDAAGRVIPGFSAKESVVMTGKNSTRHLLGWKGHKDLSSLGSQPIRIRFYITEGHLYSFWISPWETGESRGYTSGGGPGLHPSGIDTR